MKFVMIVNSDLGPGLAANSCTVLGISLGKAFPGMVGPSCSDADGTVHEGITEHNIPVLSADSERISQIHRQSRLNENLQIIAFNRTAQSCRSYDEYRDRLSVLGTDNLDFSGICLAGKRKQIDSLCASLPLYR